MNLRIWIAALLAAFAAMPVAAGAFAVAPIRVELNMGARTGVLTVRNETDSETLIQVRAVLWSQGDEGEQLTDTNDLLLTPPVFTLPAGGEQVLRVALRRGADPARELAYRLLIQEVPQTARTEKPQLTVALRISLPVFVAPQARAAANLQWQARWQADGSLQLEARNNGQAHLQLTEFDLQLGASTAPGANASRYLLPGSRASWVIKVPDGVDRSAPITVRGNSDSGEFSARVASSAS